ncbi:membrane or secreted protein [Allorhodopirellula heiligendammensis]|uniref:Uncharacterized protein n=1 Tax=Allorhodopirellula heiligendammensis TaxID=2714739 RepID=A0A5C6BZ29_9BACT|nr:membrane or secreted protein [Allorhodopirellula heiligendammensis]TWU15849.1 hypothetical protein Poly21_30510 [Allorhodopirellula heiligendammensis]
MAEPDVTHRFSIHCSDQAWSQRPRNFVLLTIALSVVQVCLTCCTRRCSADEFVSGLRLFSGDAAGVVRVAEMPTLCEVWKNTTLHKLGQDDVMGPLLEANFGANGSMWNNVGDKIGVRPKDLCNIASGEVVAAWLPFENERRRPSCLSIVADIRGNHDEAVKIAERIDRELKADGATRSDVQKSGETVRIYKPKVRPGQLKIEQVVIVITQDRMIAANRDSVVFDILEAIPQGGLADPIADAELYQTVNDQVAERITVDTPGSTVQWYVRPIAMGRIIRDVTKVDRGNKVKILNLLENQGFDAVQAMGGTVVVAQGQYDLLHRGYIHAPAVTDQPDRYRQAARILQFPNEDMRPLPRWIPKTIATATQINWKIEEGFWALETLVDEAFNDKIFRPTLAGIRDDEEGPQIDLEKNVLPSLGEHLLLLTDNTEPATTESERMLVAIEVTDETAINEAVKKAMEVEPDVTLVDTVPGVNIWKVERAEDQLEEEVFFDDFADFDEPEEKQTPLLDTWAIAMVGKAAGSDTSYLMFASHVDLLIEAAQRIESGAGDGLADQADIQALFKTTKESGADQIAIQRIVRLGESLETKYELRRRGELRDNDSVLSAIIRRMFKDEEQEEPEHPNASQWPPYDQVKGFFRNASSYVETTETGWNLNAFLLH